MRSTSFKANHSHVRIVTTKKARETCRSCFEFLELHCRYRFYGSWERETSSLDQIHLSQPPAISYVPHLHGRERLLLARYTYHSLLQSFMYLAHKFTFSLLIVIPVGLPPPTIASDDQASRTVPLDSPIQLNHDLKTMTQKCKCTEPQLPVPLSPLPRSK